MSQQTGRISAQAGVTNEISDVYAAGAQMFNELFSFPTGGELLGVPPPKNEGVPGSKLNSNNDWRVLNGQQQYDYCGGFNTQKEGNTNMQSLEAIPLYLLNPAYGGNYTTPAISFASNTATDYHQSSQNNSIQFQLPVFPQSMPSQDLCNVEQVPSRESWQSGGAANELLLLPTGNGGNLLNNNLQFAPPQQLNHTVNWANSSLQHCPSQRCEQSPMETNFRSRDERSVQGLSLSLSSNSQVQVQPFETSRLISSQDMVNRFQTTADAKNKSVDVLNGSKVGFLPPFSRSETIFPPKHYWNPNNSSSRQFQGHMMQSRYMKPTRQLLDEFCSMAEGGAKYNIYGAPKQKRPKSEQEISFGGHNKNQSITQSGLKFEPSVSISDTATGIIGNESVNGNGNKNRLNFSGDRFDLRRRKAKLLWMLDELVRRHRQYREQMKMVVISFESALGVGAATTYTSLTAKAMSRHFKCLKDAITGQIKATNDALGDNESSIPGITKGETPRLKMIEQSLRHQRGFQRVGMLEQDAWRPQRGLPERALTFLRAWLFEHFLHPYPSDADKHLLARQTGLSRSQVSNWFINARVRLWKPMVEEMYQEEAKEAELEEEDANSNHNNHEKNTLDSSGVTISLSPESQDCNNFIGNTCREEEVAAMQRENTLEHNENEVHGASVGGLDFSSYNGNGTRNNSGRMFPQQNITSTYFGSGDVSLTLGLRQTAHQEKYHNALCLPC